MSVVGPLSNQTAGTSRTQSIQCEARSGRCKGQRHRTRGSSELGNSAPLTSEAELARRTQSKGINPGDRGDQASTPIWLAAVVAAAAVARAVEAVADAAVADAAVADAAVADAAVVHAVADAAVAVAD